MERLELPKEWLLRHRRDLAVVLSTRHSQELTLLVLNQPDGLDLLCKEPELHHGIVYEGNSTLLIAVERGWTDVVRKLLYLGCDPNNDSVGAPSVLQEACCKGMRLRLSLPVTLCV